MRTTQQLSITLPNEMAELVRTKVASGEGTVNLSKLAWHKSHFGEISGLRTLLSGSPFDSE